MSNLKFTFKCDLDGNTNTQRFNTLSSKFGDGYEQNTSIGINNRSGEWTYQRTAYKAEIMQIKAFFDQHKGADSFLWDSPLDGEVRVKTSPEYQPRQIGGDVWQISTTFTQVFYP
ncbi:phage tail protein [Acinetobacter baumannii]|uniref:phage tail protein n=1 Tax=Acinetobacter TaxID=469 RepID=UPI0004C30EDC|nr:MULTISPECIES: phage tail protein [Acinetobacter]MDA3587852.1 phage tail protein [Acinetobacter sp. AOR01_HL]